MVDPLKKLFLFLVVLLVALVLIKRKDMTWRQSILKTIYPILMLKSKLFPAKDDVLLNTNKIQPAQSFYDLTAVANNGAVVDFHSFKGKKVMIVNTASDCGYTGQYDELEKLHNQYRELVILGFPANDFKQQEKADDASIAQFCRINYGVTFPIMQKTQVVKGEAQNAVFGWLSHKEKNGWCSQQPSWNFSKYLVDENGVLVAFFRQTVSPLDKRVMELLGKK